MRADLMILTVRPMLLEARLQRGRSVLWRGQTEYHDRAELADAIARLVAEPALVQPGRRLQVELARPVVQLRTLADLPPVRVHHLRALVEQQAHRYFRKNGVPLVLDAVWGDRKRRVTAHAAAVEEPVVSAIVEGARAGGFHLENIIPVESTDLSLLLNEERERRRRQARLSLRRLGWAVVILWIIAAVAAVLVHGSQQRAVRRELASLSGPVAALREARREVTLATETVVALGEAEARRARSAGVLTAISAALPDSSFLASLEIEPDGTGRLTGYARRASEVLARLDAAQAVVAPVLENQRSREMVAGREWEAFSIRFGTAPEPDARGYGE